MKDGLAFSALLLLSIVMIVSGLTGSVGRVMASLLCPSQVKENGDF